MPGTWKSLKNQPSFDAGTMLLLTDGTVMCQESQTINWWKLTPDASGSYINGTWSQLAPMRNAPLYFASAVLADGRVFVAGGEYNFGQSEDLLAADIYDPVADKWTIGDDASMATNYPLVRIRNLASNKVVYCRTFKHYMGVATGKAIHSTQFTLPPWIETGASELYVIANGISSAPFAVTVGRQPGIRAISPNADGRLELFAIGENGSLWHLWQTAVNNGWSSWASHGSVGGGFTTSL